MSRLNRRDLLRGLGAAGVLAGASALARAGRAGVGVTVGGGVGPSTQSAPCKILNIYCPGGLCAWETFQPDVGPGIDTNHFTPADNSLLDFSQIFAGQPELYTPPANWTPDVVPNGTLGLAAYPLCAAVHGGVKLINRTRVVSVYHELGAHQIAPSFVLTGSRLGRQNWAGLPSKLAGAMGLTTWGGIVYTTMPFGDVTTAASACVGQPACTRPPVIPVPMWDFGNRLERIDASRTDGLKALYSKAYAEDLTWHNSTVPERSGGFEAYDAAMHNLINHDALIDYLNAAPISLGQSGSIYRDQNWTAPSILSALTLLNQVPDLLAMTVIARGLPGGLDTHTNTGNRQVGTMFMILRALAIAYQGGLLDTTLVVINTDFGRIRDTSHPTGTGHWPYATQNILIGGGIDGFGWRGGYTNHRPNATPDAAKRPYSDGKFTPTDVVAAALIHAGVGGAADTPFQSGLLDVDLAGSVANLSNPPPGYSPDDAVYNALLG